MGKLILVAILGLSGCVQYEAIGTPPQSRFVTSFQCNQAAKRAYPASSAAGALGVFGAVGGVVAAAADTADNGEARAAFYKSCMLQNGWAERI